MKIKAEHLAFMRSKIEPLDTSQARAGYLSRGLSNRRYMWDLARAAGLIPFFCSHLYFYANDSHIETALCAIVKPLEGGAS